MMKKYVVSIVSFLFSLSNSFYGQDATDILKGSYEDERRYNEVCWLTTHNAFANQEDGWQYKQQEVGFEEQFQYGVRSFMIDLHWYLPLMSDSRYIAMCHEQKPHPSFVPKDSCPLTRAALLIGAPKTANYFFEKVHTWLVQDSNAIITVHLESYLGPSAADHLKGVFEDTGVLEFIYRPDTNTKTPLAWPTLGELRSLNKRLIIFSNNAGDGCIPVSAYQETQYNLGKYPGCQMREEGRSKTAPLFLMNHFYSWSAHIRDMLPRVDSYDDVNAYDKILSRVNECYAGRKRLPNFIAVDFVKSGDNGGARRVVATLNALPATAFHRFDGPVMAQAATDSSLNMKQDESTSANPLQSDTGMPSPSDRDDIRQVNADENPDFDHDKP